VIAIIMTAADEGGFNRFENDIPAKPVRRLSRNR